MQDASLWQRQRTNILTAFDLKKVLERNGGAKGCRVSVVELPQSSCQIDTNARIPGISQFTIFVTKKVECTIGKHTVLAKGMVELAGGDSLLVNILKLNVY